MPTPPTPTLTADPVDHGERPGRTHARGPSAEDGSLVSECGLIAVLGATITGVAISWAQGGAIATLLNVVMRHVRTLVGV